MDRRVDSWREGGRERKWKMDESSLGRDAGDPEVYQKPASARDNLLEEIHTPVLKPLGQDREPNSFGCRPDMTCI